MGSDFIIRAKCLTRNVYANGDKTTIRNIALHRRDYYKFNSRGQNLKNVVQIRIKTTIINTYYSKRVYNI